MLLYYSINYNIISCTLCNNQYNSITNIHKSRYYARIIYRVVHKEEEKTPVDSYNNLFTKFIIRPKSTNKLRYPQYVKDFRRKTTVSFLPILKLSQIFLRCVQSEQKKIKKINKFQ